ncbi:MAG: hypothetical protein K2J20_01915 [Bacilli bacterium]|nr:hypothetical protein [Bacilli bacterium]
MKGSFVAEARLFSWITDVLVKQGLEEVQIKSHIIDNNDVIFEIYDTVYFGGEKGTRMTQLRRGAFVSLVKDVLGSGTSIDILCDDVSVYYRIGLGGYDNTTRKRKKRRGR